VTPYPPHGPQPPPPSNGNLAVVLIIVFASVGLVVLVLGGLAVWGFTRQSSSRASSRPSPSAASTAALPPVERRVPRHALSILDGCTSSDLQAIGDGIDGAISIGAPLYNAGNFAGCYHLYEGTAADLERRLPPSCGGPSRALEAGRTRAAALSEPSDQAWAMRDAFDGVLDVLERKAASR
jgi:hypothetical protein